MRYRRLDKVWDLTFGSGADNYLQGVEAVAQAIKSRLLLLYKEWWEDQEDGLPLFEKILATSGSPDNLKAVDIIIRDRIAGTKDVTAILNFESSFENRKYTFSASVETAYGRLTVSNKEENYGLL